MRLLHVKLSGFKSFVDPTVVSVPSDLVGIVGPNGCGKSNVIDAIRWVMGESSAKTLRGDHMADVIFNGSTVRKPVGKASVELVFDNSNGEAPGAYAKYGEISIRRELSRDGQSQYLINKIRCRRRDITDIFLGTGLGPRSYSIIEQGMVSRVIEARPEELRVLIEEAAGISKYKERRRETETRIRHTRENLGRVEDIRGELDAQLRRLKRQSSAAARYKTLKQEERLVRCQLMSLRWRDLSVQVQTLDDELDKLQREVDTVVSDLKRTESGIDKLREEQRAAAENLNHVQGTLYQLGADIANNEQGIEHVRETRQQRQQELERLMEAQSEADQHLNADRERMTKLTQQLDICRPRVGQVARDFDQAILSLEAAEQAFQHWQLEWEEYGRHAGRPEQEREIQRARIDEHHRRIEHIANRQARLAQTLNETESVLEQVHIEDLRGRVKELDAQCLNLEIRINDFDERITQQRGQCEQTAKTLEHTLHQHQAAEAGLKSLREIQAAALGTDNDVVAAWLGHAGLADASRLATKLEVEPGWERAVDCVLGRRLGAVCIDTLGTVADAGDGLTNLDMYFVEQRNPTGNQAPASQPNLSDKVRCRQIDLQHWLAKVYIADDLTSALSRRSGLSDHESLVTRDGIWVGRSWMAVSNGDGARAGIMVRKHAIDKLLAEAASLDEQVTTLSQRAKQSQQGLRELETQQSEQRQRLSEQIQQRTALHKRLGHDEARVDDLTSRRDRIRGELAELDQDLEQAEAELTHARSRLNTAQQLSEDFQSRHAELSRERSRLRKTLEHAAGLANDVRETKHREQFEEKRLQAAFDAVGESITRLERQRSSLAERKTELRRLIDDVDSPEVHHQEQLQRLQERRTEVEKELRQARQRLENLEASIQSEEQARIGHEDAVQTSREDLQQLRLQRQELLVRRDTLAEQINEMGGDPQAYLTDLPADADEQAYQEKLERITKRVERIGPVNLVAIEEFEEQSERKTYLDKQYQDLTEALNMLESVIHKIDQETRARFKSTYDNLNTRFQGFFPRLFGGGSAYLELTGSDLLDTGVTVLARPPGKRNSTIHLLSGGEKALTAVALLFAFFDLNPAPFCILDEVDAPLDDANVERYCKILRTMADRTQLIFITHNKITMEAAQVLIGVTMAEPGVSRLVSVDLNEAIEMAQ